MALILLGILIFTTIAIVRGTIVYKMKNNSPTPSLTPSPIVSPTPSLTPSPIVSPTPSPIVSPTPSPIVSPTPSLTPSPIVSPTPSPIVSPTPIVSPSPNCILYCDNSDIVQQIKTYLPMHIPQTQTIQSYGNITKINDTTCNIEYTYININNPTIQYTTNIDVIFINT